MQTNFAIHWYVESVPCHSSSHHSVLIACLFLARHYRNFHNDARGTWPQRSRDPRQSLVHPQFGSSHESHCGRCARYVVVAVMSVGSRCAYCMHVRSVYAADIQRLESGKIEFECIPFDVVSLIQTTLRVHEPIARKKGVGFRTRFDAEDPILFGDPYRLRQVICNLVTNAVKFTAHGSISISLRLAKVRQACGPVSPFSHKHPSAFLSDCS
jgi:hypothetical protein